MALFWGEKDSILPVKHGRTVLAQSTGITLTTYPTFGHFPQLDVESTFDHDLRGLLLDPYRPFGRIHSEMMKMGLPEIQKNKVNASSMRA
ncbi:MAG: hypothetical protein R6X10_11945 [Desulfobacterales bacterium]